ncbi:MAG: sensor histidine kinase [Halioglobus sp.]
MTPLTKGFLATILLAFFWLASAIPTSAAEPPSLVTLYPGEDAPAELAPYLRYTTLGTQETVAEALENKVFERFEGNRVGFGRAGPPILIAFDIENKGQETGKWILSTGRVAVQKMAFYQFKNGVLYEQFDAFQNPRLKENLKEFHSLSLEITLQPGERRTMAVVFQGSNVSILYPKIKTRQSHQQMISQAAMTVSIASTATLVLIIFNACLYLIIRNRAYIYFVLLELSFLYVSVHMSNYPSIYLFYDYPDLGRFIFSLAQIGIGFFSVRFAQSFLKTKLNAPKLHTFLVLYIQFCLVALALIVLQPLLPFLSSRNAVLLSVFVSTSASLILPVIGIWATIRLGASYIPLMISWLILGGIGFYYIMASMMIFEGSDTLRYWYGGVGFAMAFFITIAIALDIRRIQNREFALQIAHQSELQEKLELLEKSSQLTYKKNLALTDLADKGRLILSAGHDARNFLSALNFLSDSMRRVDNVDEAQHLGEKVSESVELLNDTLSTIIYSSSSGATAADILNLEMLDIDVLLRTVVAMHERVAAAKGLSIKCNSAVTFLPGDRTLLIRILSNLIANAIKYSDQGKILVTARLRGASVLFHIYDQGAGISPDNLAIITDPARERIRLNSGVKGEGAGLQICRTLAARVGGTISARSTPGMGSQFELSLPAALSPNLRPVCQFAPNTVIEESEYAELAPYIDIFTDRGDAPDVLFTEPSQYHQRSIDDALRDLRYIVLVADDRSMEFRAQWAGRVDLIIYSPANDSLILSALASLELDEARNKKST